MINKIQFHKPMKIPCLKSLQPKNKLFEPQRDEFVKTRPIAFKGEPSSWTSLILKRYSRMQSPVVIPDTCITGRDMLLDSTKWIQSPQTQTKSLMEDLTPEQNVQFMENLSDFSELCAQQGVKAVLIPDSTLYASNNDKEGIEMNLFLQDKNRPLNLDKVFINSEYGHVYTITEPFNSDDPVGNIFKNMEKIVMTHFERQKEENDFMRKYNGFNSPISIPNQSLSTMFGKGFTFRPIHKAHSEITADCCAREVVGVLQDKGLFKRFNVQLNKVSEYAKKQGLMLSFAPQYSKSISFFPDFSITERIRTDIKVKKVRTGKNNILKMQRHNNPFLSIATTPERSIKPGGINSFFKDFISELAAKIGS